jgi:dienelactone hydrolase
MLQVTVLTPDGLGPFPLAVMNHGATAAIRPNLQPRYRQTFSAYYFLSRGYAVVLPMMRGFAGSEGRQISNGCNQEAVGLANANDIRAVIDYMSTQPYIDGSQVVVAGQSFGGWNTLAFGTLNHSHVKGLVNFSGGANISNCGFTQTALAIVAEHFGTRTKVPSLWFYGDNDTIFAPSIWRAMYEHYTAAGGEAELFDYGSFMNDSHNLLGFPEGLPIWAPRLDAFLEKIGLPNQVVHPEYLPMEFPPPTQFAALDDVEAVPYLTEEGKKSYRRFLSDPMPKVFVLSAKGLAASFNGGFDPLGRALKACRARGHQCQVYAADDYVCWARPTPAPPPTGYAPLEDVSAVPFVNEAGRQGYQKYLTLRKPKAFVISPDGAWSFSTLADDPLAAAVDACRESHRDCRYYAVDNEVVWTNY